MPYIKKNQRDALTILSVNDAENAGELNFLLTSVIKQYIDYNGLNYQHINDVLGALEGAKIEFYRRIAGPYEETKIKENGDVY